MNGLMTADATAGQGPRAVWNMLVADRPSLSHVQFTPDLWRVAIATFAGAIGLFSTISLSVGGWISVRGAVMSFAIAMSTLLTIPFPVIAGLMACLLFAVATGMPFYTASVLTGIVIAAVLIVARYSVPAGALAAVLTAGPWALREWEMNTVNGETTATVIIAAQLGYVMVALILGYAMRWLAQRDESRDQASAASRLLAEQRRRERLAGKLHDSVTNDLAYLVLRINQDRDDATVPEHMRTELDELESIARRALGNTHEVINALRSPDDDGRDSGMTAASHDGAYPDAALDADAGLDSGRNEVDRLQDMAMQGDARLHGLGFNGSTLCSGIALAAGAGYSGAQAEQRLDIVVGFLDELYANIAKHADPEDVYFAGIAFDADRIVIAVSDKPLAAADHGGTDDRSLSTGTGLARYAAILEQHGGNLTVEATPDDWSMRAELPM